MLVRHSTRIALAVAVALFAAGSLSSTAAKAEAMAESLTLPDAEVIAIRQVFKTATDALVAGDWKVWSEFWTNDAVLMPPNHPSIAGLEKLRKFVQVDLSALKDFKQSDWTFEGRGDLAVVTTGMEWIFKDGKSKTGKQIVVMVKDAGGVWRAQRVIYNLNGVS